MANNVGFEILPLTKDGFYVLTKRSKKYPTNKGLLGTCGSSLKYYFSTDTSNSDLMKESIYNGLCGKLNFNKKDYDKSKVNYEVIALVRNYILAGKPDFLVVANLNIASNDLISQFNKKKSKMIKGLVLFKLNEVNILSNKLLAINHKTYRVNANTICLLSKLINKGEQKNV
ncbi:MAG: hypothetical protein MR270_02825 [Erysipelotrichaceae bacterium]|nr:hypothetical protein [Erysipelotrichaceae bacterium]